MEIPAEFNGQKVVGISGSGKSSLFTGAKKITLPNTIREIDDYAFAGCSQLTEINIPSTVEEIGEHAFDGCAALGELTIPNGVREIDEYAFRGCTSLLNVALPDSLTDLEDNVFDTNVVFNVTYKGVSYTPANIAELYMLLDD